MISADGDKSPDLAPNYGMTGVSTESQWGLCLSDKAAEKAAQSAETPQIGRRVISRIPLTGQQIAFIPEIQKFTASMGHELAADGLMMMFIRGMTIDYGDQVLMFRDGRMRLELGDGTKAVRGQQQAAKREQKAASILVRVEKMRKI